MVELSSELQNYILENGNLILIQDKYKNFKWCIEIAFHKEDSTKEELDSILHSYECSVFPANYKFDLVCLKGGFIQKVFTNNKMVFYYLAFDDIDLEENEIKLKLTEIKFKKGE